MGHPTPAAEGLVSFAQWLGLTDTGRAPLWAKRFEMNAPELEQFHRAAECREPYYVAQAVVPEAPPATWQALSPSSDPTNSSRAATAWEKAQECQRRELNFFTHLPKQLEASTQRMGYLAGEPILVKDMIGVRDMPRTGGSASSTTEPFKVDSAAVTAVRQQGGIILGLSTPHELAFGADSDNPVYGRVVNPITPERIPGGSSGGSAAAVAAGIVDVALGTDTGGSIRIPAACCGVVGFKPSYDAVARDGVIEIAASLDHIGPIGRTVDDCARVFAALTHQPANLNIPDTPLQALRVGLLGGFFAEPLSSPVQFALRRAVQLIEEDGANIIPVTIRQVELAPAIQFMTISTEAATALGDRVRDKAEHLGEDVRVRLEMASFIPGHWYLKAQRLRRQLDQCIDHAFQQCDVLICPVMRAEAPKVGDKAVEIGTQTYPLHTAVSNLTLPFNLNGSPAIALPAGFSADGAALSIQLVAAKGKDWKLLEIAKRVETLLK